MRVKTNQSIVYHLSDNHVYLVPARFRTTVESTAAALSLSSLRCLAGVENRLAPVDWNDLSNPSDTAFFESSILVLSVSSSCFLGRAIAASLCCSDRLFLGELWVENSKLILDACRCYDSRSGIQSLIITWAWCVTVYFLPIVSLFSLP